MTISIDEMPRDLIGYLRRVQAGETIVVTEANKPVAEIKPVSETTDQNGKQLRPFAWREEGSLFCQMTSMLRFLRKS